MTAAEINIALRNVVATGVTQRVGRLTVSYQGRTFGISGSGVALATKNRAKAADLLATMA